MTKHVLVFSSLMFAGVLAGTAACQRQEAPAAAPEATAAPQGPAYQPTATIKEIMLGVVDPSADVVWNAVTTVMTNKGIVETVPKNDQEWNDARMGALRLAEAANLLMMPGRTVAHPGEKSETPGVELEPEEMDALIAKDRATWESRAAALHAVSLQALKAIEDKNPERLFEIGESIEVACETCHSQYWYPNEKVPPVPGGEPGVPPPPR